MAEIFPFRALHYNPAKIVDLAKVVTQPYDKITPAMQARYHELNPYNLVRIIRGLPRTEDGPDDNLYVRAARTLHEWIESRILVPAPEPALYPYYQEFEVPGHAGERKQRRGFIALCRLADYSERIVHRHEETLSGPKADRLDLLRTTRAHFGQIFMLYGDQQGAIEELLNGRISKKPWELVTDEYGTMHTLWQIDDPPIVEQVVEYMRDKQLVIADGHHRYETALAYRDECRAAGRTNDRAEYVMATFIRMETDGLTILPTHRLIHSLPHFDWQQFATKARAFFDWEEISFSGTRERQGRELLFKLAQARQTTPSVAAYAGSDKMALLRLRRDFDLDRALPDVAPSLRRLDVVLLHRLVIEKVLGIDRQAVREEKNLSYHRDFGSAAQLIAEGKAQVCLLLNPTPIEAVRDNALAGCPLPQKSTDFYPKLLSGLTGYWLDNPAGM